MTHDDLSTGPVEKSAIRFPNLSGAIVHVISLREDRLLGAPRLVFGARCTGCLDSFERDTYLDTIVRPREWAAKHSATCRALPQPGTNQ